MSSLYHHINTLIEDLHNPPADESRPSRHPMEFMIEYLKEEIESNSKMHLDTGETIKNISIKETLSKCKELDASILTTPLELPFTPNYKPVPYTFRGPNKTVPLKNDTNWALCPPFHVQLDHALAVIWNIFSNDNTQKLGVEQLQWTLNFLKGVHDENGKISPDVSLCISTIEEILIQKYAVMANAVKPPTTISAKICFNNPNAANLTADNSEANIQFNSADSRLVFEKLPFSVTYADMTKGKQNNCFETKKGSSLATSEAKSQLSQHLNKVITTSQSNFNNLSPGTSKNIMMEFLRAWRKEQIIKIQEELRRLQSIETFIKTVNQECIVKPYLDTVQLDYLVEQVFKNLKSESSIPINEEQKNK